jgi:hypothetical protein
MASLDHSITRSARAFANEATASGLNPTELFEALS